MAYSKTLSAEKMATLSPIIDKLNQLKPNEEIKIIDEYETLITIRLWLYNWLFLENRRAEFKISWRGQESLVIRKKLACPQPTILVEQAQENEFKDYILNQLLDCSTEEEVIQQLQEDNTNPLDRPLILKEWRRIMGIGK